MPSIEWLETLFMSRVVVFILLSLAVIWLARNNRRIEQANEDLTTRLIRLLELTSERNYRVPEKLDPQPPSADPAPETGARPR